MVLWPSPSQKNSRRSLVRTQRAILQVEALETRDCPSAAPQIAFFTATAQSGHTILLSGTITDSSPTAAVVDFGGVASGSATPDASGHFQVLDTISQLGTATATVTDPGGSKSGTAQATVSDPGVSIRVSVAQGPSRTVTVTGQVSGNSPAGLTVTLSGVVAGSVTTNANGTFIYTGPASALGQIQATVTDVWGVTAASSTMLTDTPPRIVSFEAINNGNNSWTFTGQVQDEYAAGLVVRLGGIPCLDNNNASATVQANGTFTYTVTLEPGENGGVTAECTDWWGQASNQATAFV
jgi:hypothetical protein